MAKNTKAWSITAALILVAGTILTGPAFAAQVHLSMGKEISLATEVRERVEATALELLRSSNFNSVAHADILKKTIPGVQRAYRAAVTGNWLLITFDSPQSAKTIGGVVEWQEIVIGLGKEYANSLFTIDPVGRVVQHEKYDGRTAIDLLELAKKAARKP